ncbi:MAG TPA: hypothetical protein VFA69_09525 [Candidatus Nitrosotalea sp.]|nr:hypothetical protein [Candidatus Nitrosotalea sp.]
MKKGVLIGIGIVIIVIVFAVSWFVGKENANNPQLQLPSANTTTPVSHSYHLNFTESMGIRTHS